MTDIEQQKPAFEWQHQFTCKHCKTNFTANQRDLKRYSFTVSGYGWIDGKKIVIFCPNVDCLGVEILGYCEYSARKISFKDIPKYWKLSCGLEESMIVHISKCEFPHERTKLEYTEHYKK